MKMKFKIIGSLSVVSLAVGLSSCSADKDSAGLEFMPDMYRSSAIEPYVDYGFYQETYHPELKEKLSAKTPPMYTIPFYGTDAKEVEIMLPYHLKPNVSFKSTHGLVNVDFTQEDTYTLAANDKNPLMMEFVQNEDGSYDNLTLKKGKELFGANCMHCHGEKGKADGPMMTSGAYSGAADLTTLSIADGQKFYSIYYGKGMMGAHGLQLDKKEIWTLVHYINKLQNADYGKSPNAAVEEVVEAPEAEEPANEEAHH